jgi:integrase
MLDFLDKGVSAKSVNFMHTVLKVMLGHALKKGFIKTNPCVKVQRALEKKKSLELLNPEEVKALFDPNRIEKLWGDEMYYTLNMPAATTGIRIGECQGLKGSLLFAG